MHEPLPRQWILSPDAGRIPAWMTALYTDAGWTLAGSDGLTCALARIGSTTAALIGAAIDTDRPELGIQPLAERFAGLPADRIASALEPLTGNYALLIWRDGPPMIYTDPAAAMGIYLAEDRSAIASSPTLLGATELRDEIADWFGAKAHNNWIPGRKTVLVGVEALPANHALDLRDRSERRFWPTAEDAERAREDKDPASTIARELSSAMRFVEHDERTPLLSLTGGRDSRANLAAARGLLDQMRVFTLRTPGAKADDAELAGRLADKGGFELETIDCPPPEDRLLARYDRQCAGQSLGGGRSVVSGCAKLAAGNALHINGGLGVLLKDYYGARRGPRSNPVALAELLTDFEAPPPLISQSVERWLASVESLPPQAQRTLMYLEQRASRWMGPIDLGSTIFYDAFSPFTSRRVALAAAFAPDKMLMAGRLHASVIERLWPDLLDVPFTRARSKLVRILPRGLKERLRPIAGAVKRIGRR